MALLRRPTQIISELGRIEAECLVLRCLSPGPLRLDAWALSTGEVTAGEQARAVVRGAAEARLSTLLEQEEAIRPAVWIMARSYNWPGLVAADHNAGPLLLDSDLADHAKNLRADPQAARARSRLNPEDRP